MMSEKKWNQSKKKIEESFDLMVHKAKRRFIIGSLVLVLIFALVMIWYYVN